MGSVHSSVQVVNQIGDVKECGERECSERECFFKIKKISPRSKFPPSNANLTEKGNGRARGQKVPWNKEEKAKRKGLTSGVPGATTLWYAGIPRHSARVTN